MRFVRLIAVYDYSAPENLPNSIFSDLEDDSSFAYDWAADDASSSLANDDGDSAGAAITKGIDGPHRFGSAPKSVIGSGSGTVTIWEVDQ